jgi:hypothetical protein
LVAAYSEGPGQAAVQRPRGVDDDRGVRGQQRQGFLDGEEHAFEVRVHDAVELVFGDLGIRLEGRDPRVGEHDIEAAVPVADGGGERVEVGQTRRVGSDREHAVAAVQCPGRGVQPGPVPAGDDHLRAFGEQPSCRGQPHAARAAGDERDLAVESGDVVRHGNQRAEASRNRTVSS